MGKHKMKMIRACLSIKNFFKPKGIPSEGYQVNALIWVLYEYDLKCFDHKKRCSDPPPTPRRNKIPPPVMNNFSFLESKKKRSGRSPTRYHRQLPESHSSQTNMTIQRRNTR